MATIDGAGRPPRRPARTRFSNEKGGTQMLFNRIFNDMDRLFGAAGLDPTPAFAPFPPLNVWEDEGHLYTEAELPGMKLDDISVTLTEGDQLTIAGERKWGGQD